MFRKKANTAAFSRSSLGKVTLTLHVLCEAVGHCLHCPAHGHFASLQQLLYYELPGVSVQGFSGVDVMRVSQHPQNFITISLIVSGAARSSLAEDADPVLH